MNLRSYSLNISRYFILTSVFVVVNCLPPRLAAQEPAKEAETTMETLNKTFHQFSEAVTKKSYEYGGKVKGLANDEYEKLIKFEYRVVDLPREAKSDEVQAVLTELGKDRWNCFHADTLEKSTRVYCRRLPFSVLRMAPYLW